MKCYEFPAGRRTAKGGRNFFIDVEGEARGEARGMEAVTIPSCDDRKP